ncbi:uncharacterized protein LOC119179460 isoform X2 [Rhipicephalus microplus]|uniref:uncharacterized protein LOC119179460 isoform X2 n=1 Tax=Rhipicephalus microplus TaxID=6941 RepID=UPI003F6D9206
MDAGKETKLALVSTHEDWPQGYNVWPSSALTMKDADSVNVCESGAHGEFVVLEEMDVYEDEDGGCYDRGGFCTSTDSSDYILGGIEEDATCEERVHNRNSEREMPKSENNREDGPVEVEEEKKNMEPGVASCASPESLSHSLVVPVPLSGDRASITCIEEDPPKQSFGMGNHVQRLRSWAVDSRQSESFNTISTHIGDDSSDEERLVMDIVDISAEIQKNGGHCAVKVRGEEKNQVPGSDQLAKNASEEPAHKLSASSDNSSDPLAGGAASRSLNEQNGPANLVLVNYEELDKVVAEGVDESLEKDVRALLQPLEVKYSGLLAELGRNCRQTIRLSERLGELIQVQKLPTDATQTPDRGARTSKHRASHKKPCHWYPSTSWRRQVRKGRQKRLWDSFYEKCASSAVTEHGLCESDSDGSVDIYQCDQPEVRPAAVAKCQSKQAFKVSRGRHGRHTPKDGPLNQIPYIAKSPHGFPVKKTMRC